MIKYKKACDLSEMLIDRNRDMVSLRHRESLDDGICAISCADFEKMTGSELLEKFNGHIDAIVADIANARPVEIPEGQAQLKWNGECEFWQAAGDVLRCQIRWEPSGDPCGQPVIRIDNKQLSGEEFLKLLAVYEGWGMRIEFMHPNRLTNPPELTLKQVK
ncbi:MAG: hypothetical protein K2X29_14855 [Candidatus Obscuribacterales bacterium]|nr:hypothetical protein [Candidatus Obscuribacterales bacterium]